MTYITVTDGARFVAVATLLPGDQTHLEISVAIADFSNEQRNIMTLETCKACGHQVSSRARACPNCGEPRSQGVGAGFVIAVLLLISLVGLAIWQASKSRETNPVARANQFFEKLKKSKELENIKKQAEYKVIDDAVNQYNIAKRQGDPIQICVQAGFVAAAYLQANDEYYYRQWKRVESAKCKTAGMP